MNHSYYIISNNILEISIENGFILFSPRDIYDKDRVWVIIFVVLGCVTNSLLVKTLTEQVYRFSFLKYNQRCC